MSEFEIEYSFEMPRGAKRAIAPTGLATPHGTCVELSVSGGTYELSREAHSGQPVAVISAQSPQISLRYRFDATKAAPYPEQMFAPHPSRFTRYADALVAEAQDAAQGHEGLDRAIAIARATAARFTYGHPEKRFNDGLEAIPALGCDLVEGSCVDINTYFIASLRAAGIEAGYVTGFFFPAEKGDHCEDGHCWVVTRIDGECHAWDIAHHLKLGTLEIAPGLNPKPGFRAACFHSMGLDLPELGFREIKALIEPLVIVGESLQSVPAPSIRLRHPSLVAAAG